MLVSLPVSWETGVRFPVAEPRKQGLDTIITVRPGMRICCQDLIDVNDVDDVGTPHDCGLHWVCVMRLSVLSTATVLSVAMVWHDMRGVDDMSDTLVIVQHS